MRAKSSSRSLPRAVDPWLAGSAALLVLAGIVMVYSSSAQMSQDRFGDSYYILWRHLTSVVAGALVLLVAAYTPLTWVRKGVWVLLGLCGVGLILVLIPGFSAKAGGAARWLKIAGYRIGQPAEFAKLAVVIYLASSMARKQDRMHTFTRGFLPHIIVGGATSLLVLMEPDFGMAATIGAITMVMLYMGGVRFRHIAASALLVLPLVYWLVVHRPYRWRRIVAFLDPMSRENIQNSAYQLVQSLKAFATGGLTGLGLGAGRQKLGYLPEAHTDFVFSIVGEELGFIGVVLILGTFGLMLGRGVQIALRSVDPFRLYLAMGLVVMLGMQVLLNTGVVMGVLPTKGMAMPFISFGRSSLIACLAAVGLLINVARAEAAERDSA